MSFLLINLVVLAVVASAGLLAYAQMRQSQEVDEWLTPAPGIDYAALQAHWGGLAADRDWESLQAPMRRWHEAGDPAVAARCDVVARKLGEAAFRFAVLGDAPTLGRSPAGASAADTRSDAAHCPARLRARA